jgi:hypothetical protein
MVVSKPSVNANTPAVATSASGICRQLSDRIALAALAPYWSHRVSSAPSMEP